MRDFYHIAAASSGGARMTRTDARRVTGCRARVSRRVVGELRPHWWRAHADAVRRPARDAVILLTPIPLKIVVDSVIGDHPPPAFISNLPLASSPNGVLWIAAILQVLVVVFAGTQAMAAYSLSTWTGERMTLAFRARLFRHIQRLSILLHDRRGTADSVYRVQYDGTAIADITTGCVLPVATSVVALVITLFVMRLSWQLCLVALVPPGALLFGPTTRRVCGRVTRT
jgi:ATP-binding cassette subfamily B protein